MKSILYQLWVMSKSLEKGAPPPRPNFPSATQKKWFGGGLGVKKNRFLGVWVIYETTQYVLSLKSNFTKLKILSSITFLENVCTND